MAGQDPKLMAIYPRCVKALGYGEVSATISPANILMSAMLNKHAVTFAAGLPKKGLKPVVAIYSTFLKRAYGPTYSLTWPANLAKYYLLSPCLVVGADGPTHQGAFDIAFFTVYSQHWWHGTILDENECPSNVYLPAISSNQPAACAIREVSAPRWTEV